MLTGRLLTDPNVCGNSLSIGEASHLQRDQLVSLLLINSGIIG